ISLAMLLIVVGLIVAERRARRHQRYAIAAQRSRLMPPAPLAGAHAAIAFAVCFVPILLGFIAPAIYLVSEAIKRYRFAEISSRIVTETINTLTISVLSTILVLLCGLAIAYAGRLNGGKAGLVVRIASLGYAVPGTVLA